MFLNELRCQVTTDIFAIVWFLVRLGAVDAKINLLFSGEINNWEDSCIIIIHACIFKYEGYKFVLITRVFYNAFIKRSFRRIWNRLVPNCHSRRDPFVDKGRALFFILRISVHQFFEQLEVIKFGILRSWFALSYLTSRILWVVRRVLDVFEVPTHFPSV